MISATNYKISKFKCKKTMHTFLSFVHDEKIIAKFMT